MDGGKEVKEVFVPVFDKEGNLLMSTRPSRARRWIRDKQAVCFFRKGVFCIRLLRPASGNKTQPVAIGIDPGSKREGFSVKSKAHTYLNIQAKAVDWVQSAVETRRNMRRSRRFRKTPCRKPGPAKAMMAAANRLPPSTKARWQWKLRILRLLVTLFPVTDVVVEDIQATTKKGKRKWNRSFSPLQVGKSWFYAEIRKMGATLHLRAGFDTKRMRDLLGLKKTSQKLAEKFSAHCVDAWVLARDIVGGCGVPDNVKLWCVAPLQLHRRQLHRLQPEKGGVRRRYGSTRSLRHKRGSLIRHWKHGLCIVGGFLRDRISLHNRSTYKRITQNARPEDCILLAWNAWVIHWA